MPKVALTFDFDGSQFEWIGDRLAYANIGEFDFYSHWDSEERKYFLRVASPSCSFPVYINLDNYSPDAIRRICSLMAQEEWAMDWNIYLTVCKRTGETPGEFIVTRVHEDLNQGVTLAELLSSKH